MRVLGLDPATNCGFAWSDGKRLEYGCWRLIGDKLRELEERILEIGRTHGVDKIAFEEAGFGAGIRQRQTMMFHNELRGVIRLVAQKLRVPTVAYVPPTIKKFATGNGRAEKRQLIAAAKTFLRIEGITSDMADAIWICKMAEANYQPPPSVKKRKKAVKAILKKQARLF